MFTTGWIFALVLPLGIFACGTAVALGIIISRSLRTRQQMLLARESKHQHTHRLSPPEFEDLYKKPRNKPLAGFKVGTASIRAIPYHETAIAPVPRTSILPPVQEVSSTSKAYAGFLRLGALKSKSNRTLAGNKRRNNKNIARMSFFRRLFSSKNQNQVSPGSDASQPASDTLPRLSVQIRHSITSSLMNEINMAFDGDGYMNTNSFASPQNSRKTLESVRTPEARLIQGSSYRSGTASVTPVIVATPATSVAPGTPSASAAALGTHDTPVRRKSVIEPRKSSLSSYRGTILLHTYGTNENGTHQSYFPPDLEKLMAAATNLDSDDSDIIPPDRSDKRPSSQMSGRRLSPPLPIKSKYDSVSTSKGSLPPTRSEVLRVVHPYQPVKEDELELRRGEKAIVLSVYPDNWCYVRLMGRFSERNPATDRIIEGYCPTACFATI